MILVDGDVARREPLGFQGRPLLRSDAEEEAERGLLDAHTTRRSPSLAAARKTLKFIVTLALNVTAGVPRPGAGMLAR